MTARSLSAAPLPYFSTAKSKCLKFSSSSPPYTLGFLAYSMCVFMCYTCYYRCVCMCVETKSRLNVFPDCLAPLLLELEIDWNPSVVLLHPPNAGVAPMHHCADLLCVLGSELRSS